MDGVVVVGVVALGTGLWLWLLRRYDKVEPESVRHLVQVAVIGGGASVAVAALVNKGVATLFGAELLFTEAAPSMPPLLLFGFFLLVGFNEEICKAVAAVYVAPAWGDLDEPVDAMIYAMTVGLGFAAIENVFYALRFGPDVLLARFLWPVPAHMAYSAVWGYGLAKALYVFPRKNTARVMALPVALAGFVHAAANLMLFQRGMIPAALSLAALTGLAYLAHLRLRELVAESPHLAPGECPECLHQNPPRAARCAACSTDLRHTDMFVTCPCGQARVPAQSTSCGVCGAALGAETPSDERPPIGSDRSP